MAPSSQYVCDTLPPAKLAEPATDPAKDVVVVDEPAQSADGTDDMHRPESPPPEAPSSSLVLAAPIPQPRKLCVRHQRMADEGTNLKLQQAR